MTEPEGLRCENCGEEHREWEKVGEPFIPAPDARGRCQRVKCGSCGATDEVLIP